MLFEYLLKIQFAMLNRRLPFIKHTFQRRMGLHSLWIHSFGCKPILLSIWLSVRLCVTFVICGKHSSDKSEVLPRQLVLPSDRPKNPKAAFTVKHQLRRTSLSGSFGHYPLAHKSSHTYSRYYENRFLFLSKRMHKIAIFLLVRSCTYSFLCFLYEFYCKARCTCILIELPSLGN